jgi:hypothetical protein
MPSFEIALALTLYRLAILRIPAVTPSATESSGLALRVAEGLAGGAACGGIRFPAAIPVLEALLVEAGEVRNYTLSGWDLRPADL